MKNLDLPLQAETGNDKQGWLDPELVARDLQWQIQDFPEGATTQEWGANLLFGMIFAENCMKMKMDFVKHTL